MEKPVLATGRLEDRVPLSDVVADCVRRWFRDTLEEAKTGDAMMQVLVGQMYQSGYGVPRNEQKANAWFTKASRHRSSVWKVIMLVIQILMRLAWRRANSCLTWMHYFGAEMFNSVIVHPYFNNFVLEFSPNSRLVMSTAYFAGARIIFSLDMYPQEPFLLFFRHSHGFSGLATDHKPRRASLASFSHCMEILSNH
ncbi:hypothetical protein IEQ34_016300 [Dendrobium chrysotoxum]|uniref:Sel1-like protein n=1 Tax=Dendrobium chrysotoxum TaxID=161865 RepID=A0AAV7GD42_DENCH|nr:hypothetical protein IEQ34_016300 [Dendrobium chrysotoxum]